MFCFLEWIQIQNLLHEVDFADVNSHSLLFQFLSHHDSSCHIIHRRQVDSFTFLLPRSFTSHNDQLFLSWNTPASSRCKTARETLVYSRLRWSMLVYLSHSCFCQGGLDSLGGLSWGLQLVDLLTYPGGSPSLQLTTYCQTLQKL